jgi:hypothetical protein
MTAVLDQFINVKLYIYLYIYIHSFIHVVMHAPAGGPCVVYAGDVGVESPLHLRAVVIHCGVSFGARVIRCPHPWLHAFIVCPNIRCVHGPTAEKTKTDQISRDDNVQEGKNKSKAPQIS